MTIGRWEYDVKKHEYTMKVEGYKTFYIKRADARILGQWDCPYDRIPLARSVDSVPKAMGYCEDILTRLQGGTISGL